MFENVNHAYVVNLKGKKKENRLQASLLMKKGCHSLIFVLEEGRWPSSMLVSRMTKLQKMYHTFVSLDGLAFSGAKKDFYTT